MPIQMSRGEQIKVQRQAVGLSREELAVRAEVSLSTLIRTERSLSVPNRATLAAIRRALADAEREAAKAES